MRERWRSREVTYVEYSVIQKWSISVHFLLLLVSFSNSLLPRPHFSQQHLPPSNSKMSLSPPVSLSVLWEQRFFFSLACSILNHTWYTVQKYFQNICCMNEYVCENLSFTLQPFLWTAPSLIDLFACTSMSWIKEASGKCSSTGKYWKKLDSLERWPNLPASEITCWVISWAELPLEGSRWLCHVWWPTPGEAGEGGGHHGSRK